MSCGRSAREPRGFLGKGAEPDELLAAIRTAAKGDALLSPAATKGLIASFLAQGGAGGPGDGGRQRAARARWRALTGREREVLTLVGGGLTNDEIAERLAVSPLTVKTHVNRTLSKLGARDRAQLVVAAYENGPRTPTGAVRVDVNVLRTRYTPRPETDLRARKSGQGMPEG